MPIREIMFISPKMVAAKFSAILREWLTPADLLEIDRRNKTEEYGGLCATHDFCDPNQAMIDALESFGLEYEGHDEVQGKLIDLAWSIAKANQFDPDTVEEAMRLTKKQKLSWFYHSTSNMVCPFCRKSGKLLLVCSGCGEDMIDIGKRWRVPKKGDDREWKKIMALPWVQSVLKKREQEHAANASDDGTGTEGIPRPSKKRKYSRRYNLRRGIQTEGLTSTGHVTTGSQEGYA